MLLGRKAPSQQTHHSVALNAMRLLLSQDLHHSQLDLPNLYPSEQVVASLLFCVGCLVSQQNVCVFQGRIFSDDFYVLPH